MFIKYLIVLYNTPMIRYLILPVVLQALLIIHVFKTGKDRYWIYLLLFIPFAGGLAYFFVEVLPDLMSGKAARQAKRQIFSQRDFNELKKITEYSPTVENKQKLAAAYCERRQYSAAIPLLEDCLSGVFNDDVHMRMLLIEALYNEKQVEKVQENLTVLLNDSEHREKSDVLFWQAQLEDSKGEQQSAIIYFEKAAQNAVDLKYQYFYLEYLATHGSPHEALQKGNEFMHHIEHFPRHSKQLNRKWIRLIKKQVQQLKNSTD